MGNPLLRAGTLDRRVTIERATATADEHNEQVMTWAAHATRSASAKPAPGFERFQSAETAAEAVTRFVFRYEADLVRVTDRLRHDDGRLYYVASVIEIGRHEGWEVLATAREE